MFLPVLFAACYSNVGFAPKTESVLPPHPTIIFFDDRTYGDAPKLTATLDGKPVKTTVAVTTASPYRLVSITIESDKTGTLAIDGRYKAKYTIVKPKPVAKTPAPAITEITATTGRFHQAHAHSTVHEMFDGLAIHLDAKPVSPPVLAHVKIRRDASAAWSTIDIPIADDNGPTIRLGELGCTSNYTVALLETGVDLEITVTLADGKSVAVKLDPPHVVLAKDPTLSKSSP